VTQPCPPSDQSDGSFLRRVVIGELLGVDATLPLRLAEVMHQCALLHHPDAAAASQGTLARNTDGHAACASAVRDPNGLGRA
jgi:hypothetical protein